MKVFTRPYDSQPNIELDDCEAYFDTRTLDELTNDDMKVGAWLDAEEFAAFLVAFQEINLFEDHILKAEFTVHMHEHGDGQGAHYFVRVNWSNMNTRPE